MAEWIKGQVGVGESRYIETHVQLGTVVDRSDESGMALFEEEAYTLRAYIDPLGFPSEVYGQYVTLRDPAGMEVLAIDAGQVEAVIEALQTAQRYLRTHVAPTLRTRDW